MPFIDLFDDLRFHLEVSLYIHETVDLLLHIRHLCVAEAADIRHLFHRRRNLIETADKFFLTVYFIPVSPAAVIIVESNSTMPGHTEPPDTSAMSAAAMSALRATGLSSTPRS